MKILLTGGTGVVGGAIIVDLHARGLLADTLFMVRAANREEGLERLQANAQRFGLTGQIHVDQILCGDLGRSAEFAQMPELGTVTHVMHCAALATFSNNPQIWGLNVDGTLALAHAVFAHGNLQRWIQVGTAMSCGSGLQSPVSESWDTGNLKDDHMVPYTWSKVSAELALRAIKGFPLVVARPSIIVGHSALGCAPSPSIFWVFRMAFALERFTCAPNERIDIIPADWCAQALNVLLLKDSLSYDLYHVSAGMNSSSTFTQLDDAYAKARGSDPIGPRYEQVELDNLRSLVPLFQERLGKVNRILILRALTLYGAFAQLNYVFDNQRIAAEGIAAAPPLASYLAACVASTEDIPMAEQMAYDFK